MNEYQPRHRKQRRIKETRTRRRLQREAELIRNKNMEDNAFYMADYMNNSIAEHKNDTETVNTQNSIDEIVDYQSNNNVTIPDKNRAIEKTSDKKHLIVIISFIVLCLLFIFGTQALDKIGNKPAAEPDNTVTDQPEPVYSDMPQELKDVWLSNKAINPDYVGNIVFDSELLDLPIVQAKDVYDENGKLHTFYTEDGILVTDPTDYNGNDVYIWTSWINGEYDPYGDSGSVFMDFRNDLEDQNLIIYGHHFARDWDPSGSKLFTPLDLLFEEENYESNKTIKLILDNEIREYNVTNIFMVDIENDFDLNFMRVNMDEDLYGEQDPGFFKTYIEYINKANKYQISEGLNENDKILTLVTCIQHQPQYRQIVIAKETGRTLYN